MGQSTRVLALVGPSCGERPILGLILHLDKDYIGASKFQRTVLYMVLNKVLVYHLGLVEYTLQGFDILSILPSFSFPLNVVLATPTISLLS